VVPPRDGVQSGEDVVVEAAALEEREVGEVRRKSRDRGEGAVGDFFKELRHLTLYAPYLVRAEKWKEFFEGIGAGADEDRVQKKREIRKEGDKKRTGRHPQLERLQLWPLLNVAHPSYSPRRLQRRSPRGVGQTQPSRRPPATLRTRKEKFGKREIRNARDDIRNWNVSNSGLF
jgi:hypothetical protein